MLYFDFTEIFDIRHVKTVEKNSQKCFQKYQDNIIMLFQIEFHGPKRRGLWGMNLGLVSCSKHLCHHPVW